VGSVGRAGAVLGPLMIGAGIALLACEGDVDSKGGQGGSGAATTTSSSQAAGEGPVYGVAGYAPPPYGVGGWGGWGTAYGIAGAMPPYGIAGFPSGGGTGGMDSGGGTGGQ
jgi:hypothetical protein